MNICVHDMEVSGHWLAHPSYGTQVPPSNEKVRLILVTENNNFIMRVSY